MKKIRLLGLTFIALTALGAALAGPAWASGAPENLERPTIVTPSPKMWELDSGTKGTWTNSPTTFAYQWQRCNAAGAECVNIPGATMRSGYEVVPPDVGHTLVFKVTASNSAGQASASSLPSSVIVSKQPEFIPEKKAYPVEFQFRSSGGVSINWGGATAACEGMSGSGRFAGPSEITAAQVTLSGCHAGTFTCKTMTSGTLHGYLGYLNAAAKTVGLELQGESSLFATISCNGSPVTVQGRLIGQVATVNHLTNGFQLTYEQAAGVQKPDQFEGGPTDLLEWNFGSGLFQDWGIQATDSFTTSQKGEIVA